MRQWGVGAVANFGNGPIDLDIRDGEAPAQPLTACGWAGASPSRFDNHLEKKEQDYTSPAIAADSNLAVSISFPAELAWFDDVLSEFHGTLWKSIVFKRRVRRGLLPMRRVSDGHGFPFLPDIS